MRELTTSEINQVGGGFAPWAGAAAGGFAVGAFSAGATSYLQGNNWQTVAGSALLGGLAGATGGIAATTLGAAKALNTVRSVAYTIASGTITASGPGVSEVDDFEKLDEK